MVTTSVSRLQVAVGEGTVSVEIATGAVHTGAPATLVLGHGAGAGMASAFMQTYRDGLAARGFCGVTFNFPYTEARRRVPDSQPVLRAAYRAVVSRVRADARGALFIGGKSLGGRVASYLAADGEPVAGLVFLGYPLHPPGQPDRLRDEHLYAIARPMLFVQGTRDPFARPERLDRVMERLGAAATLCRVEGGDHSLGVRGQPRRDEEILDRIAAWMRRITSADAGVAPPA